jgi:hypothetical protein
LPVCSRRASRRGMVNRSFPVPIHREIERAALAGRRKSAVRRCGRGRCFKRKPRRWQGRGFLHNATTMGAVEGVGGPHLKGNAGTAVRVPKKKPRLVRPGRSSGEVR